MNSFKQPALKQLTDQQVRFTPPPRRMEQLSRAEQLLAEVDAAKAYPYQYVCFRVTDFRPLDMHVRSTGRDPRAARFRGDRTAWSAAEAACCPR